MLPTAGHRRWILIALALALLAVTGSAWGEGALETPAPDTEGEKVHPSGPSSPLRAIGLSTARWMIGGWDLQTPGSLLTGDSATGHGVRVALIDTGIHADHPDLTGKTVAWRDFVNGKGDPYDDHGHGTHIAGIIAGQGHAQWRPDRHYFPGGLRGVAPEVELLVAKAMNEDGSGSAQRLAQAVLWALDPNEDGDTSDAADVINLSLGVHMLPPDDGHGEAEGPAPGSGAAAVERAVKQAVELGTVVVVAAGNQGPGTGRMMGTPATMPEVITVGATDHTGRVADYNLLGPEGSHKPDLYAPGAILSTTGTNDGYTARAGTSMAAPMVTGAVALLLETDPRLGAAPSSDSERMERSERVRWLLSSTAGPVDGAAGEAEAGMLRVDAALRALSPLPSTTPLPPSSIAGLIGLLAVLLLSVRVERPNPRAPAPRPSRDDLVKSSSEATHDGDPGSLSPLGAEGTVAEEEPIRRTPFLPNRGIRGLKAGLSKGRLCLLRGRDFGPDPRGVANGNDWKKPDHGMGRPLGDADGIVRPPHHRDARTGR